MKKLIEVGGVYKLLVPEGYCGGEVLIVKYDEEKKLFAAKNGFECDANGVAVGEYWGYRLVAK